MKLTKLEISALARQIQKAGREKESQAKKQLREAFKNIAAKDAAIFKTLSPAVQKEIGKMSNDDFLSAHYNNSEGYGFSVKSTSVIEDEIILSMLDTKSIDEIKIKINPLQ